MPRCIYAHAQFRAKYFISIQAEAEVYAKHSYSETLANAASEHTLPLFDCAHEFSGLNEVVQNVP